MESFQVQSNNLISRVDVVLGAQLGDEGKGRLIDILGSSYDIVARCNSGGNAGHKVVVNNLTYAFHLVPSGILNPNVIGVIGNGCVINLKDLKNEIETIQNTDINNPDMQNIKSRLYISDRAHIVLDLHKEADAIRENLKSKIDISNVIGTTKQGMGPVYSTKALRVGLRMCDLLLDDSALIKKIDLLIDELNLLPNITQTSISTLLAQLEYYRAFFEPMIIDTVSYLNNSIKQGKKILVEGAQACLLDIDFGVYPYCTATNCTIGAVSTGLGIPPRIIGKVNYVMKTYCTRVGNGPFPTEQLNKVGTTLQELGHEYGTTTGRRRRCGWLDIPMVKWALMINGVEDARICLTKLDVLDTFEEICIGVRYKITNSVNGETEYLESFPASLEKLALVEVEYETFPGWQTSTTHIREYDELPIEAKKYISRIEQLLEVPVKWIGVGADREAMIIKS